jgi:hypothetical protein
MAVLIVCDVCDTQFRQDEWEGLTMTIPPEMLDLSEDRDEETYTICSWGCVHGLAQHMVGDVVDHTSPQDVDEPVDYVPTDAVVEAVKKFEDFPGNSGPVGTISFGNNPLETRIQPTDETPMDGITRDRQIIGTQVRLRRQ